MGLTPDLKDFDHTIHDSRGIVGVKDGVEYPVSEEDWKKAHPEHRNVDCKECTFVLDTASILSLYVPREVRDKANKKPKFVGKFTMPGWSGHSGFYLFGCPECDDICVDYPHGYSENGCIYVRCNRCQFKIVFYPDRHRDIYSREGVVPPPTIWQQLSSVWNSRPTIKEWVRRVASNRSSGEGKGYLIRREFYGNPLVLSNEVKYENSETVEVVDPVSFGHSNVFGTTRGHGYWILIVVLIVYFIFYGIRIF